jgi:hypothetical protein
MPAKPVKATAATSRPSAFSIGVIADVQYTTESGDWPDGRCYTDAPGKAAKAVADWRAPAGATAVPPPKLSFNLGDIVDRRAGDAESAGAAWDVVMAAFDSQGARSGCTTHHIHGNHDLTALGFREVARRLRPRMPANRFSTSAAADEAEAPLYFAAIEPDSGALCIMLDTYDLAVKGRPSGQAEALELLQRMKKKRSPGTGQHEELNGGVGKAQLAWLAATLDTAAAEERCVVVMSHAPLVPYVTHWGDAVCWNGGDVRSIINAHGRDTVVAVLSGHDHFGGRWDDTGSGIPHVVVEAAVMAPKGEASHGFVVLEFDAPQHGGERLRRSALKSVRLEGRGNVRSHVLFPARSVQK